MSHAKLSPSGASRWMRCAGSVREEAKFPDEESNAYSIDGTHSHTLLEACLMDGEIVDASEYLGKTLTDHEGTFTVEQDRVDRVQIALDYIKGKVEGEVFSLRSEEQVDPGAWIDRTDLSGTADVQLIFNDTLEVIDYKDGYSPVSATENPQLMLYALGALYPYAELQADGSVSVPFTTVKMTIIQPKLGEQGIDPISSVEMPVEELLAYLDHVQERAEATDDPNAPLTPGEIQCTWCKARGSCEARATQALATAQVLFGEVEVVQQVVDQDVNILPDTKIREIVEALPLLRSFIKDVEAEALRRFESGIKIPGLKVVAGRGSRTWADSEETIAARLKGMGVPKDHIFPAKLVSPAQAEKLKWENRKGEAKSLTPKQMKNLEKMIAKKEGKPAVVSESDSRPAIAKDAATIFKGVTVETKATEVTDKVETPPALPSWLT